MAEDPYVYPGTNVLRNHFGLRDPTELSRRERNASAWRAWELRARPLPGRYDLAPPESLSSPHLRGRVPVGR